MSESTHAAALSAAQQRTRQLVEKSLKRRYRAEWRFKAYGIGAVLAGLLAVGFLFVSIIGTGISVFRQAYVQIEVEYAADVVDPAGTRKPDDLRGADYMALVKRAMREQFPDVEGRANLKQLYALVSDAAAVEMQKHVLADQSVIGTRQVLWVLASDETDQVLKGKIERELPELQRTINDQQLAWIDALSAAGKLELRFNKVFFTAGDSREPEQAGVWGAVKGSFYTLFITLLLSFPIGVAAAVYLEEFAKHNRFTDLIEVNINNLAAVPSIVFGLLGLAVFIQFFGVPRSAPLAGGLVLTLMTLPTIIIASRAALKGVPPSIREAALGMGASQVQMVAHHVLPLAMPGMLTGAIIGMARALGESAPLLMIGMVAFIVDVPGGITDPSTALPVQVYLWADSPERAFLERTSGAIMVLLGFLLVMNASAVLLRQKFERRW
ncbi:MAG: phosphate ABC transporter permease PstA [Steroidobacteraceae bacterium]|nr:phosphate ABC transporter permease PstA [Steroidobacteraceae bacterium]MCC7199011.1 phosphate ABC transporter permease PstA [Gammaproteobacteria bacterium]